jgi:hypothetical protein
MFDLSLTVKDLVGPVGPGWFGRTKCFTYLMLVFVRPRSGPIPKRCAN